MRERLLTRLTSRNPVRQDRQGFSLVIDADDITAVWDRFPGLDPGARRQDLPAGLLVVSPRHLQAMATGLEGAAERIAGVMMGPVAAVARAWGTEVSSVPWGSAAEILVAGLGLGCAVPRLVAWRVPAVFAVDWDQSAGAVRPPFLRLEFLPGSGGAGLALLSSRRWPGAVALAARSEAADWGQTFASYAGHAEEVVAYGLSSQALTSAGVLRRQGISLQSKCFVNVPAVSVRELAEVENEWRALVHVTAIAVNRVEGDLRATVGQAFGRDAGGDSLSDHGRTSGEGPLPCDYLDAAYFVMADLVYDRLLAAGGLGHGEQPRNLKVRAAVLERPAEIWEWLVGV